MYACSIHTLHIYICASGQRRSQEHLGIKWASDGALLGPWTHMVTKMKAQVHKITLQSYYSACLFLCFCASVRQCFCASVLL